MANEDNSGETKGGGGTCSKHHSEKGSSNLTSAKEDVPEQQPAKRRDRLHAIRLDIIL